MINYTKKVLLYWLLGLCCKTLCILNLQKINRLQCS